MDPLDALLLTRQTQGGQWAFLGYEGSDNDSDGMRSSCQRGPMMTADLECSARLQKMESLRKSDTVYSDCVGPYRLAGNVRMSLREPGIDALLKELLAGFWRRYHGRMPSDLELEETFKSFVEASSQQNHPPPTLSQASNSFVKETRYTTVTADNIDALLAFVMKHVVENLRAS